MTYSPMFFSGKSQSSVGPIGQSAEKDRQFRINFNDAVANREGLSGKHIASISGGDAKLVANITALLNGLSNIYVTPASVSAPQNNEAPQVAKALVK